MDLPSLFRGSNDNKGAALIKLAMIALVRDGMPLVPGEGYRLVIPGDKKGGRAVSGVASIEVK